VSPPPPLPGTNRNLISENYAMPPSPAIPRSTSDPYLSCTSSLSKAAPRLPPSNQSACSNHSSKSSYWQAWSNIRFILPGRKSTDWSSRHSNLTEESLEAHNRRQEAINILHDKNAKCSPYYKGLVDYSLIISRERHHLPIPPTSPCRESHATAVTSSSLSTFIFKMQEWSSCFSISSKSNNVRCKENNAPAAVIANSTDKIKPMKPRPAAPSHSASSSSQPSGRTTLEKETRDVNALRVVTEEKPLRERVSESKPPAAAPSLTNDDHRDILDCPGTHDVMNIDRKFTLANKYQPKALKDFICNRDQAIRMQGVVSFVLLSFIYYKWE